MKRALKNREKAVLKKNPSSDGVPVEPSTCTIPQKTNRRSGTQVAMIGLAISMGATSLLVTRQSDQAQAAAPVGTQKAASTIPAVSETEIKFAATKLESQAVSSVSQVPGLEAKGPVAAKEMAMQIPSIAANGNAVYLPTVVGEESNSNSVQSPLKAGKQLGNYPLEVASQTTAIALETTNTSTKDVEQQLKAQQEFALSRLQEKSNRLRSSLAELRSQESGLLISEQTVSEIESPVTLANKDLATNPESAEETEEKDPSNLISRLKQDKQNTNSAQKSFTPKPFKPTVVAKSVSTTYEVKPGDTLAEIASSYRTSISEIVKANNLNNPHHLQINQKLIIPTDGLASNSYDQPTIVTARTFNQPSVNTQITSLNPSRVDTTVTNSALSEPDLDANLPVVPQTPENSNSNYNNQNSVTVPVPVASENQVQTNIPTPSNSISIPVPVAQDQLPTPEKEITTARVTNDNKKLLDQLEQQQATQNPPEKVAKVKGSDRIRSLQTEIERLRAKYRTQKSDVNVATTTEDENTPVPVVVTKEKQKVLASQLNSGTSSVSIPVPKPNLPSYKEEPTKVFLSAVRPTNNEPINPQFLSNPKPLTVNSQPNSSGIKINVPPANMNSNDSLGKLRGTTVSPASTKSLPPLAAVDIYLPKPVDQTTQPGKAYIWPAKGVLTSGYGWRWGRMHRGIDIANGVGTPIYASADGIVERAGWNRGGYGNVVDIRHPDGSMTRYAHNSRILVRVGQRVEQGQTIAAMGSTGFSTGPHSHFEIHRAGKGAIDPIALLPKERL